MGQGYGALVDGVTNNSLAGDDVMILKADPIATVNITGISNKVFDNMPIVQCTSLVKTADKGKIVLIMSQYDLHGSSKTIHSNNKLKAFGCHVFDLWHKHGGCQAIFPLKGM